jgi:exodeoxyribonuclease VII small subunit
LSFEQAYDRLDEIVKQLDAGGLTVEESLRLYEEGIRMARLCNQRLDAAELRVTTLQREVLEASDAVPDDDWEAD